jgi:uncharacterized LabA/DUF88 family protein
MNKNKENNYAFIDGQNLNLAVNSLGWKLDYSRFRVFLRDKFAVSKAFYFVGFIAENQHLYDYLTQCGYELIYKPILEYKKGGKAIVKGNVDAELVLHAMIEYKNYEKAVIVSGDGDFHCIIEHLQKQSKLKRLVVPNFNKFSALLRKFMPEMTFLNKNQKKLEYKKRGINLRTKP